MYRTIFMSHSQGSVPKLHGLRQKRRGIANVQTLAILAIVVVVAGIAGAGVVANDAGLTRYACLTITHQGSGLALVVSGVIHESATSQYFVNCSEGADLPTTPNTTSCLTITPQVEPPPYGSGASTYYYYLSVKGGTITPQGPISPGNETVTPGNLAIQVSC